VCNERAFAIGSNRLTVVDTADGLEPVTLTHDMSTWCYSLEAAADTAYCLHGHRGVEVIDLSSMR